MASAKAEAEGTEASALDVQAEQQARGVDGPARAMAEQPQAHAAAAIQGKLEARAQSEEYYNQSPNWRGMSPQEQADAYETHLTLVMTQEELDKTFNPPRIEAGLEPLISREGTPLFRHHSQPG